MRAYFRFVLAHPGWVIFACIFLTILSGVILTQMTIASSLVDLILGDDPDYQLYAERAESFGNDEILIVAFPEPELASEAALQRLRNVAKRIEEFPEIETVQNIASLIPESSSTPVPEAIARLVEHPLIHELLVSKDGAHTAVIVQFAGSGQMDLERSPQIEDRIVEAFVARALFR